MSVSYDRITLYFEAFSRRVDVYIENAANPYLHLDNAIAGYEGLYNLIQRVLKELESGDLSKQEKKVCCEIRDDTFLNGLLELRTIGTHVQSNTAKKRGDLTIYVPSGQPVEIPCESSAGAVFSRSIFETPSSRTGVQSIDHKDNLITARSRINNKLNKATESD